MGDTTRSNRHEDARSRVERAVRHDGAAAVARRLGASRAGVLSYVAGTARQGTALLIESRVDRLGPATPPTTCSAASDGGARHE
jgi:hypothetical protein